MDALSVPRKFISVSFYELWLQIVISFIVYFNLFSLVLTLFNETPQFRTYKIKNKIILAKNQNDDLCEALLWNIYKKAGIFCEKRTSIRSSE